MRIFKKISIAMACISLYCIAAETFVMPKKKDKKISMADVKIQCGDLLAESLSLTPELLEYTASMQTSCMHIIPIMLDQSYFQGMTKQELQECMKSYQECLDRQRTINLLMKQQSEYFKTLKKRA